MCGPFCDSLCQLIGATWADSSARNRGTVHIVRCRTRLLGLFALVMGLISCGALALAVTTDYWLHTEEPFYMDNGTFICLLHINSGLWRGCFQCQYEGIDEMIPVSCFNINYGGVYGPTEMDKAETTWAILRSMRKSSPVLVLSLLTLIIGFGFSTLGNTKGDHKTLVGAIMYIIGALGLAVGVIFYISGVNDEVHHRKKPENPDDPVFQYSYDWAFFFGGSSFIFSMITAVANVTLYLKRYQNLEDMVEIIPGLDKKGQYGFSRENNESHQSLDYDGGSQNPTIIL